MTRQRTRGDQLREDTDALRVVLREAHEVTKDLRTLIREAGEVMELLNAAVVVKVNDRIEAGLKKGLEAYGTAIVKAIDDATDAVYARFDAIVENLTDGGPNEPSIDELAHLRHTLGSGAEPTEKDLDVAAQIVARRKEVKG